LGQDIIEPRVDFEIGVVDGLFPESFQGRGKLSGFGLNNMILFKASP
jgi:hypothetical protein